MSDPIERPGLYHPKYPVPEGGYGKWVDAEIRRIAQEHPEAHGLYVSISWSHDTKPGQP